MVSSYQLLAYSTWIKSIIYGFCKIFFIRLNIGLLLFSWIGIHKKKLIYYNNICWDSQDIIRLKPATFAWNLVLMVVFMRELCASETNCYKLYKAVRIWMVILVKSIIYLISFNSIQLNQMHNANYVYGFSGWRMNTQKYHPNSIKALFENAV
jgi:hypothetical protein